MKTQQFYSHGKLLLTGEYLVLDGAKALAIPCKYGQYLEVSPTHDGISTWLSYDHQNKAWLKTEFDLQKVVTYELEGESDVEKRLFQILKEAFQLNSEGFTQNYNFKTHLEFPKDWGLGTSSTLIANLAKWAKVNPYDLLSKTFGGSGYDIACADSKTALTYQIDNQIPKIEEAKIPEHLKAFIYFVHLEQKQNSRDAISNYKAVKPKDLKGLISEVNSITEKFQKVKTLEEAEDLISQHEALLSKVLQVEPIKTRLFSDFKGGIKSLGAWGGDFIMVLSRSNPSEYFTNKGFKTILNFQEMSL
ncbi:GYDIA family GHMP kinase [Psychroflexus montanilacus]|uniref:GYDIA family GHMP kinase n=1 Tax=Psychroflexus montanilacus TaxID=2873598 RepID=UPI001CCFE4E0|nr:GYDIA family GHMP kinase [Psychroflexus montanilacus]MBZ9652170.1 mevalonate kinase [Psychroflexus montanilacus]